MLSLLISLKEMTLKKMEWDCKIKHLKIAQNECQHPRKIEDREVTQVNAFPSSIYKKVGQV